MGDYRKAYSIMLFDTNYMSNEIFHTFIWYIIYLST